MPVSVHAQNDAVVRGTVLDRRHTVIVQQIIHRQTKPAAAQKRRAFHFIDVRNIK